MRKPTRRDLKRCKGARRTRHGGVSEEVGGLRNDAAFSVTLLDMLIPIPQERCLPHNKKGLTSLPTCAFDRVVHFQSTREDCSRPQILKMAKTNYSFEKRQRDLAKKAKKDEKLKRKQQPASPDSSPAAK